MCYEQDVWKHMGGTLDPGLSVREDFQKEGKRKLPPNGWTRVTKRREWRQVLDKENRICLEARELSVLETY